MDDLKLIMDAAEDRKDLIAFMNQQVWSFAEPGFREYKSAEVLIKALEDAGFTVKKGIAGIETAFVARFGPGSGCRWSAPLMLKAGIIKMTPINAEKKD